MNLIEERISSVVRYNTFYNINNYFERNYQDYVKIYRFREWCRVFNTDSKIINNIFGNRIFKYRDRLDCCGFRDYTINQITDVLKYRKLNYVIIDLIFDKYTIYEVDGSNISYINETSNYKTKRINNKPKSGAQIGDFVTIQNMSDNSVEKYSIIDAKYDFKFNIERNYTISNFIPETNLNADKGIISSNSPVGRALLYKNVGDIVELPDGKYRINKIQKASDED